MLTGFQQHDLVVLAEIHEAVDALGELHHVLDGVCDLHRTKLPHRLLWLNGEQQEAVSEKRRSNSKNGLKMETDLRPSGFYVFKITNTNPILIKVKLLRKKRDFFFVPVTSILFHTISIILVSKRLGDSIRSVLSHHLL